MTRRKGVKPGAIPTLLVVNNVSASPLPCALTFLLFLGQAPGMTTLSEILIQHKSKTLEFKRDVPSPESIIRTVVAFSKAQAAQFQNS
jgi:hypothetical protein